MQEYKALQNCSLRLKGTVYLIGVPDPCDVLQPGEVWLKLPGVRVSEGVTGKVVVSRNPMCHPGDVRVLESVLNNELKQFFAGTHGVIIFSAKGLRSSADEMSGGDFDGDEYIVLYGNNAFIEHVQEKDPFVDDDWFPDIYCVSVFQ